MSTPEDCARRFPDDRTVADDAVLLRRIPPWHFYVDENLGRVRPSSAAFEDDQDGDPMSVYRNDVLEAGGQEAKVVLVGHEGYALAALSAGQVRSKSQTVYPDPLPEQPAHAKICGPKSKSTCRWFAKQAQWLVEPPAK